jgi:hypothetical protein
MWARPGHIQELVRDQGGWVWNDLTNSAGAPPASGPYQPGYGTYPTPASFAVAGGQHVFYGGGPEGHIHELRSEEPGVWRWNDLSSATASPGLGPTGGPIAAYVFKAEGTRHVVYAAQDGNIHELWWRSDLMPVRPPIAVEG